MKNGSTTITKKRKSWRPPGHASTSTAKPNIHEKNSCSVFGEINLVSCIMSCSNRTRPLLRLSTEYNWWDWALKEKRAHYYSRHDKIIFLHDNARLHIAALVETYLETFKGSSIPPVVFSRHCSFRLPLVPIDDACLSSTSHHMKIPKIVSMIG